MRIHKNKVTVPGVFILLSIAVLLFPADVVAGMIRFADMGNGGGHAVNLTLEQITVTPIRAYIGNAVVVEVVIDNREEGSDSSNVEIYANKKVVANKMFRWGGAGEEKKTRLSFTWDTTGIAPGEYIIRAEVFVHNDISPFDNELTMKEPVILVAPGEQFPGGASAGGSAKELDPRYK